MADRKIVVEVKCRLVLRIDDDVSVKEVIDEMDYGFNPDPSQATLEDETIEDFEVVDSK